MFKASVTEMGMLGSKPTNTVMDPNLQLDDERSPNFKEKKRYRSLVDKLIYLMVTRPDITFAINTTNQCMQSPR